MLAGLQGRGRCRRRARRRRRRSTVCDECTRTRNDKKIKEFVRTRRCRLDPRLCLLEQGLLCCGLATRAGCGALCPRRRPCIGCYGPNDGVVDYGARLMTAFASVIDADEPEEIDRIIDGIPDPVGKFYRFSLASSLLRGSRAVVEAECRQVRRSPPARRSRAGNRLRGVPVAGPRRRALR